MKYLASLLDKKDRCIRIAAGEALALISENGSLEKLCDCEASSELKETIHNQFKDLSAEASGKSIAKKDLHDQRNLFRDIVEYIEGGDCPETSVQIGGESLKTSTWSQMVQLNYLKRFLGGGFVKHVQENELLHCVFGFTPRRRSPGTDRRHRMSSKEKRLFVGRLKNNDLRKTEVDNVLNTHFTIM